MNSSGKTDAMDGAIHLSLQKIEKLCRDFVASQGAAIESATVESSNETLQAIVQEAHSALEHMQRRAASLLAPTAGDLLKRYADLVKWFTKTVKNGLPEGDATRKALLYMMGYKHRRYTFPASILFCFLLLWLWIFPSVLLCSLFDHRAYCVHD